MSSWRAGKVVVSATVDDIEMDVEILKTSLAPSYDEFYGNKRRDLVIRRAIDDIQNLLFDPEAPSKVYPLLLDRLSRITESDGAAIVTISRDIESDLSKKLKVHQYFCLEAGDFLELSLIQRWLEKDLAPSKPMFFSHPIPSCHANLFKNHPVPNALLILPIFTNNRLRALCLLVKKQGYYASPQVSRLTPLIGSVICALQSAESVRGRIDTLNDKIANSHFLNSLLTTCPLAVIVVGAENKITYCNPASIALFAPDLAEKMRVDDVKRCLEGKLITHFLPNFSSLFQWSNQHDYKVVGDHRLPPQNWEAQTACRLDRSEMLVNLTLFRHTHANQRYTVVQIQDVTARLARAEAYQDTSQQLSALTQLVPVAIIRVDGHWHCGFANDRWYEFSGLSAEENNLTGWINALHHDDVESVLEELRASLKIGSNLKKEVRLVSPIGQVRWTEMNTQVLFDDRGAILGFLATFADITERYIHQERLRHVAEYDSLTGLANRYLFQDRLKQAFYTSERERLGVVIMYLDLDGFKIVNDSLGHAVGDKLLKKVGERLLNILRRVDTVARFGGDEFVILLSPHEKQVDIAEVASKIIQSLAQSYQIDGHEVCVTSSVGISIGTAKSSSPETLMKQADAALYLAKAEGKNNFQFFNEALDRDAKKRVFMAKQTRSALKHSRFFLEYQPLAEMASRGIIGFEALVRFKDEAGSCVYPGDFIGILEENGAIVDVGKWVIDEACRQLSQWHAQQLFPLDGFMSINVSPKQFLDDSLLDSILGSCERHCIRPQCLTIEVTESVLIDKPAKIQRTMSQLKEQGIRFALDDFGTGYSSLTYLQQYPFDHLKIDKSFVANLGSDENSAKITKSIIALGKSMGLTVTAEGVADEPTLNILSAYGADYYQGYFLGRSTVADTAIAQFNRSLAAAAN
ncbi:EAL domain-containing protein [Teredinibacter turnerae]|uniref:sensor domain-containing protein n=1 Tax=Teredinibacter turnerae TaxID=2426 RepID=UPI0012F85727|nr:EAL domain-containing protein [Teredinibacter turnerae]